MIVYHHDIHFTRLTSHLMCPMQSQMAGVRINELPEFLAKDLDGKTHSIIVNDPLNLNAPLLTLLSLKGVMGYLLSRNTRVSEREDESIPYIDMTREVPVWEPSETSLTDKDDVVTDPSWEVINNDTIIRG